MTERNVRIAAIGDVHFDGRSPGALAELFARVNDEADILALLGDLTTHGEVGQMEAFLEEIEAVDPPIVAVLGNHDYEGDAVDEICALARDAGVHLLDGTAVEIEGIGFAGTKGFPGGFDRGALGPFGEPLIKEFVQAAVEEALKLERALRELRTEERIALLHYSPVADTLEGEPERIYPFLGSSRLAEPIDTLKPSVVFHGHAHRGSYEGRTASGVPVFNVAQQVLEAQGLGLHVHEVPAPDRRKTA